MTKREMQHKIKLEKAKSLLLKMDRPISMRELELADNVKLCSYQLLFDLLKEKKLITFVSIRKKSKLWIDSSKLKTEKDEKIADKKTSLGDAVYVHDCQKFEDEYRLQSQQAREGYKSAKVHVGISPIYG